MSGLLQTIMFFGYSALLSGALATICGMKGSNRKGWRSCLLRNGLLLCLFGIFAAIVRRYQK